jgi:hypothetical protein
VRQHLAAARDLGPAPFVFSRYRKPAAARGKQALPGSFLFDDMRPPSGLPLMAKSW